ncbi:sigma factor [Nonomuraea sp. NPDC049714]|uniref:sigma factor n=1 Tax=Nonomuraea sp. NPDC049714 TaxID=3364357 RepID=UPI0037B8ACF2
MPRDRGQAALPLGSIFDERAAVSLDDRVTLMNLAFRMLGSTHDAEDVVQDAYARWYAMSDEARRAIRSRTAWLVRVTSRICLA